MSIKKKLILLITLVALTAVMLISGCSIGIMSIDEYLKKNGARNQQVTYYANGGTFSDETDVSSIPVKNIYYKPDSYITKDFGKEGAAVTRVGYVFDKWYFVETDADGNPVYTDKANNLVKLTDNEVDFNEKIPENTHWHIGVKWTRDVYVSYVIACDTQLTITADGKEYKNGDEIYVQNFGRGSSTATVQGESLPRTCGFAAENATFLQAYRDEACTKPFIGYDTLARPKGGEELVRVYAKFIAGNYEVVRDKGGVASMLNLNTESGKTFYFFNANNPEKVIDCTGNALNLNKGKFTGTIFGNGFTLKNLTYYERNIADGARSVFGAFEAGSCIKDLTIENISVTMSLRSSLSGKPDLYLISSSAANATFDNFVVDGVELNITCPNSKDIFKNLSYDAGSDTYACGNLIFGGLNAVTDKQFIAGGNGISVKNYQLKVNVGIASDVKTVININEQEAN